MLDHKYSVSYHPYYSINSISYLTTQESINDQKHLKKPITLSCRAIDCNIREK